MWRPRFCHRSGILIQSNLVARKQTRSWRPGYRPNGRVHGGMKRVYFSEESPRSLGILGKRLRCNMKRLILVSVAFMAMLPMTAAARVGVFVGPRFAPYGWYGW